MVQFEGYEKAKHQAAGHDGALTDSSGALFIKPTTQQEIDFYTRVQALAKENDDDEGDSRLIDWIPVYLGTLEHGITEQVKETQKVTKELTELDTKAKKDDKQYAVLQNLLYGFKNPSIIDIKLGSILHDENTPEEKIKRLDDVSNSTTSGSLNYRVCGIKLYHDELPNLDIFHEHSKDQVKKVDDGYIKFDKWFGRALTSENVGEAFKVFFDHNKLDSEQRKIIIRNSFTRLQLLYNCLLDSGTTIRSGSLFLVYENNLERWAGLNNDDPIFKDDLPEVEEDEDEDEDDDENEDKDILAPLSTLSLIDFAHASFTPDQTDDNLLKGVENLLEALEALLD